MDFHNVDWSSIFTSIGVAITAMIGYLNSRKISTTSAQVQEVHLLTNSMKDQLIAAITTSLTAQFGQQIAEQKLEIALLKKQIEEIHQRPVHHELVANPKHR